MGSIVEIVASSFDRPNRVSAARNKEALANRLALDYCRGLDELKR
jgi:hypothetical protein